MCGCVREHEECYNQEGKHTQTKSETSAVARYYLEDDISKRGPGSVQQIKRGLKLRETRVIYFAFSS